MRQIQFALALTSVIPLVIVSYLVIRYVSPTVLIGNGAILVFPAIMVLMLTGTRMVIDLAARAHGAAANQPAVAAVTGDAARAVAGGPHRG